MVHMFSSLPRVESKNIWNIFQFIYINRKWFWVWINTFSLQLAWPVCLSFSCIRIVMVSFFVCGAQWNRMAIFPLPHPTANTTHQSFSLQNFSSRTFSFKFFCTGLLHKLERSYCYKLIQLLRVTCFLLLPPLLLLLSLPLLYLSNLQMLLNRFCYPRDQSD